MSMCHVSAGRSLNTVSGSTPHTHTRRFSLGRRAAVVKVRQMSWKPSLSRDPSTSFVYHWCQEEGADLSKEQFDEKYSSYSTWMNMRRFSFASTESCEVMSTRAVVFHDCAKLEKWENMGGRFRSRWKMYQANNGNLRSAKNFRICCHLHVLFTSFAFSFSLRLLMEVLPQAKHLQVLPWRVSAWWCASLLSTCGDAWILRVIGSRSNLS